MLTCHQAPGSLAVPLDQPSPSGHGTPPTPAVSIELVAVDELKADPSNARRHSAKQIRLLGKHIGDVGFNVPLTIRGDSTVITGHARLAAVKKLGWTQVPCIRLEHLSETQRRAFQIADNRLAEIATWDDRLLAEQLQFLTNAELNFDIETIGFDMGEIDLRIESLTDEPSKTREKPLVMPAGPAVTRGGDLWRLGRHLLLCDDARDEAALGRLMGKERASAVISDPPYNVTIGGHVSGIGHREFPMATGEMSSPAFANFLTESLARMKSFAHSGALAFICMDWRHIDELLQAAKATDIELINLCVWTKPNGGMGSLYRSQHELVFVFKLQPGAHCNNVQLGTHGRNRSNVWPYAVGPGFGRAGEEGPLGRLHPTPKPVQMMADAILDVTRRGDIVLDPFLGSGTTLIAAERVGRRCFGTELDPLYCDVIIERWQTHAGDEAILLATGQSFAAVKAERLAANGATPANFDEVAA